MSTRHASDSPGQPRVRNGHLRTRLIVATLALLTAICVAIGVFSHLSMSSYLTGEIDGGLTHAAGRAGFPDGGRER
ncbi:hypothetical protein [Arthrobacter sp. Marseille-P9274]|uniref:hypothetical protein n=1 Tax=Arthrobacter sp. Marseille-P9274 TaxID=2866572 RepID=UPI0021C6EB35|nr:hypothetical protein [Arthrobacter sp. Marseille-P9274]